MGVPIKLRCKHLFIFYLKCYVLMSNLSESFNSTILQARDKSILAMCEWIRNYVMNRVIISLVKLDKWKHNVIPIPRKILDREILLSGQWLPTGSKGELWQVHHPCNELQFVDDLGEIIIHVAFGT